MNIGKAVREIKKMEGTCAVVCLPCLARGIYKLKQSDRIVARKIKYVITLLCNHVPSYHATDYLIKKYRAENPDLIKYRGDGWFGSIRFYKKKTDDSSTGYSEYFSTGYSEYFSTGYSEYFSTGFSEYFWQQACVNCRDHFGKYADVSMGDADFIKYRFGQEKNIGETMILIRNLEIASYLRQMASEDRISLQYDISEKEMDWIYGPLENEHRADSHNLECDISKVFRTEAWNRALRIPKNIIKKIMLKAVD